VGLEATIPAFERAKTVHALDRSATVTGSQELVQVTKYGIKLNSVAFSVQANYTDRATGACGRSYCKLLRIEGVAWSAQRIPPPPPVVNSVFLTGAATFSFM
jgi:hypothetical protein